MLFTNDYNHRPSDDLSAYLMEFADYKTDYLNYLWI